MTTPCFQEYLDRFGPEGWYDCGCGRRHALVTREVSFGRGVAGTLREQVVDRLGAGARVWALSDENTEAAAGEAIGGALGALVVGQTVLPASPKPATTAQLAERLSREAAACRPALVLAIGAGTISDLGKMVSLNLDLPNWCVATAPSADAYGSGTAATKSEYRALAVPCLPSERIICDLEILEQAPHILFLSGLGDLLAKFLAFLDWNLAALVAGEYYCREAAELAVKSARRAIEAAALERTDRSQAVTALTDALLTSSFAMQAMGNSRPAATAEHTVGHFWEISHAPRNAEWRLHGLLVGLASRLLLTGYRGFYAQLPAAPGAEAGLRRVAAEAAQSAGWRHELEPAMAPYRRWIEEERNPELDDPGVIRTHLEHYREHRPVIEELASPLLAELERAVGVLEQAGYPFRPSDYGLSVDEALLPFRYVRVLRRRYGSFHLMHELGRESAALERIRQEIERLG
ncbi:MAG: iron-containing alcohol dehydrogenase [Spirochaetales bacterium]|nr:iron-containing alcohol dehydrogenase [Spirochaetales bacterium]